MILSKSSNDSHLGITYVRKALHLLANNIVSHLTQTETTMPFKSFVHSSHCHSVSIIGTVDRFSCVSTESLLCLRQAVR